MKKLLLIFSVLCCTMAANAQTQPTNEIWYTSTDHIVVTPCKPGAFGTDILTNTYDSETDKGVITFNGDVTRIGEKAFYGCSSLASVSIPDNVTSIGERAFQSCSSLPSITIPNNVTSIGQYSFYGCSVLASVNILGDVTNIGKYSFYNCTSLVSITIPSSVTSIGGHSFYSCSSLAYITVLAEEPPALGDNSVFGFNFVPNDIPVFVSSIEAYSSCSWGGFSQFFISYADYKQNVVAEINAAIQGASLYESEEAVINDYLQQINNVPDELSAENVTAIRTAKNAAMLVINLRPTREAVLAAIEEAMQGETSAYLTNLVQEQIDIINGTADIPTINSASESAIRILNSVMDTYKAGKAEAFGEMGTECEDCPAVEVKKNTKTIILYGPESVTFKKTE